MKSRFSVEYWQAKGLSEADANLAVTREKQKVSDQTKARGNPFSKQYWLNKGLTEEEAKLKIDSRTQKSKATNIERGNTTGNKNPFSKSYWGERGDEVIADRLAKTSKTKQELGTFKGDSNVLSKASYTARGKSLREKQHNCPEYWVKRGLSVDEAVAKAKESADRGSLKYYQEMYGNDLGAQYFLERRDKCRSSWNPLSVANRSSFKGSKEANKFFKKLYKALRRVGVQRSSVQFSLSSKTEFFIKEDAASIFFYDFVLHQERLIVEYNGTHVHPSPNMSADERSAWRHAYSKKTADEVDEYTNKKKAAAKLKGFRLIEVWSDDDQACAIQLTLKELNENHASKHQADSCTA